MSSLKNAIQFQVARQFGHLCEVRYLVKYYIAQGQMQWAYYQKPVKVSPSVTEYFCVGWEQKIRFPWSLNAIVQPLVSLVLLHSQWAWISTTKHSQSFPSQCGLSLYCIIQKLKDIAIS